MKKAYLFDLWETLAHLNEHTNKIKFPKHEEMLIKNFEDVDISQEDKDKCLNFTKDQKVSLFEDSEEVIKKLKSMGYKLAIISDIYSLSGELAKKELKDFFDLFDFVAFSYELGIAKPNLDIFKITLKRLGIKPEEAVMVGDNINKDILPAKEIGMKTILIDRTKQNLKELI